MFCKRALAPIVFLSILFLFLYKLDYPYFFTDEVLYIDSGREHLQGIYTTTMQVPLIPKYIAGIMYNIADHNVLLLRLPFALMGFFSSIIIYTILKQEYGYKWGIIGAIFFTSSYFIYTSSRMVMLEPIMHLTWLLFLYFYYNAVKYIRPKWFIYSGVFLGLAFASKVTSIILIPFSLLFIPYHFRVHKSELRKLLSNYLIMYSLGIGIFISTYFHAFYKLGEKNTIKILYNTFLNTYFVRNLEGKLHIVNNQVYTKSPYWTYAYYLYIKEGILRIMIYLIGIFTALFNRNFFVYFWGMFFILSFLFLQLLGIKNDRYISSFEIPLIILTVSTLYYLSKKVKYVEGAVFIITFLFFIQHANTAIAQTRTEYNALFVDYLKAETNNYTSDDNIYIYGSIRSSRWYKHRKAEGKYMFEISKDLVSLCPVFDKYEYIIIEKEEMLRYGKNILYEHVIENISHYEQIEKYGFLIFKKINDKPMNLICDKK